MSFKQQPIRGGSEHHHSAAQHVGIEDPFHGADERLSSHEERRLEKPFCVDFYARDFSGSGRFVMLWKSSCGGLGVLGSKPFLREKGLFCCFARRREGEKIKEKNDIHNKCFGTVKI